MRKQVQLEKLYHVGYKRRMIVAGAVLVASSALVGLGKLGYDALKSIISEPKVPSVSIPNHDGIPFGLISRKSTINLEGRVTDIDLYGSKVPQAEGRLSFVLDNQHLIITPYDFNCNGNAKIDPIKGIYATLESAMSTTENVKVILSEDDLGTKVESIQFPCRKVSWGN